ncbi:MAG: hypothetical protein GQ569_10790 [Methylococcaceae bacterium]|nr:hypothetical protein [Methylococcaceae bacterium]
MSQLKLVADNADKKLWHLAVPYRLPDDEALEVLLFGKAGVLKAFADLGLLEKVGSNPDVYGLHSSSKAALVLIAEDSKHKTHCVELHQALADFFGKKDKDEAFVYHQFCATGEQRLEKYNLTPKEYWYLLLSRFDVDAKNWRCWKFGLLKMR